MTAIEARLAAPATSIRRQGIAPRTATVGLHVVDTPLQRALHGLGSAGLSVPCWGREDLWMADDRATRTRAASQCAGCLVMAECQVEADLRGERFGVWAGQDRTPK